MAGLLITCGAAIGLSLAFDLTAIASIGSAIALMVFALVTVAHLRVRRETGARAWLLVLALVTTVGVLLTFIFTTLVHEPATAFTLLGILVLSVTLVSVRTDHAPPVYFCPRGLALMMPTPAALPHQEIVRLDGHLLDSMVLPTVLDAIADAGASYTILDLDVGATRIDQSHIRLELSCRDEGALAALLEGLQVHGVNVESDDDADLVEADKDGVLPEGFYSTTNFVTAVRVDGRWVTVERPEMDCAIVVSSGDTRARTVPMHRVRATDWVVVGIRGVQVGPDRHRACVAASSGSSSLDVSSEKPKGLMVERVAASIRKRRQGGGAVLAVCGPAVVHTGAAPAVAAMVRKRSIPVLFAGNGFATHDIESSVLGTSLGIPLSGDEPSEHGHANHLRVINNVRRFGSIRTAVEAGWLRSGVLFECVRAGVPFVLGGSVPRSRAATRRDHRHRGRRRRNGVRNWRASKWRSCWRQHCTPWPLPATCSPPRSKRSAWT